MADNLRKILGVPHRCALSLEEFTTNAGTDDTVVMKGPLADVYSDALDKVYNKDNPPVDPATDGTPSTDDTTPPVDPQAVVPTEPEVASQLETEKAVPEITKVVLESQAIDATLLAALAEAQTDQAPVETNDYATLYAIDETQVKPETIVDVTKMLNDAENPENVSVLIDKVLPANPDATPEETAECTKLAVALEGVTVAMGGKVFHKFGDYLTSRKK